MNFPEYFEKWFGISKPGIGSRLARGAFWSLLGTLIYRPLTLLSSIVAAHLLGKENFGALGIIQSTIAMFQVIAGYSLGLTATKYVSEFRKADPERAGRIIGMSDVSSLAAGILFAAGSIFGAHWLAARILGAPELAPLLRISSIMIALGAYNGAQTGTISGFEAFRKIAKVNLISGVLAFPIMIAGLWFGGLTGAVWALVISMAVTCTLSQIEVLRLIRANGIKIHITGIASELQLLWRFYLPALLSGALVTPIIWLGNTLLVRTRDGFAQMAILNAATQWRTSMMLIPNLLVQVALPMLSGEQSEAGTTQTFNRALVLTQKIMVMVAFPTAAAMMFLAGPIMRLYGRSFVQGSDVLIGFACASLVQCIIAAVGPYLESRGRMWAAASLNGVWGLAYILTAYLGVDKLGALAIAFGSVLGYVVLMVLCLILLRSELPGTVMNLAIKAEIAALALAAFCVILPPKIRTILAIPVTLGVTAMVIFNSTGKEIFLKVFSRNHGGKPKKPQGPYELDLAAKASTLTDNQTGS